MENMTPDELHKWRQAQLTEFAAMVGTIIAWSPLAAGLISAQMGAFFLIAGPPQNAVEGADMRALILLGAGLAMAGFGAFTGPRLKSWFHAHPMKTLAIMYVPMLAFALYSPVISAAKYILALLP